MSGNLSGVSSWVGEAAPGSALPVPPSVPLLMFVWAGHDLDQLAEPDKTQLLLKTKKEKLFSRLNHTNAGSGWEGGAGIGWKEEGGQQCLSWQQSLPVITSEGHTDH